MSKPAPREWFIKNSFVDDHANIDGPKTKGAHVIEKPAYDRLAEENKILKNVLVGGEYNYNSVRETLALMAEGEGSDYKFYMHMAKHALTILDEALKRVEGLE